MRPTPTPPHQQPPRPQTFEAHGTSRTPRPATAKRPTTAAPAAQRPNSSATTSPSSPTPPAYSATYCTSARARPATCKINQYVNTGAGNASFAMWYRYDTTLDPTGDKPAVLLQQDGAGRSLLTLRPSNQYHTYVNATDVLSNNTVARGGWQHIAVSFDQTSRKVKFYVNGALDSEKNMGNLGRQRRHRAAGRLAQEHRHHGPAFDEGRRGRHPRI